MRTGKKTTRTHVVMIFPLHFSSDILPYYILHVSEVVGHTEGCEDCEKPESFDGKGRVGQVSPAMETCPATEFPHCHVHCKILKVTCNGQVCTKVTCTIVIYLYYSL